MDPTTETSLSHKQSSLSSTMKVTFQWRKFRSLITGDNESNPTPLYTASFNVLTNKLTFKSPQDNSIIGTSNLHAISISPDYELHGVKGTLKAQKRLRSTYAHMSTAYSDTGAPVRMTWISHSGFKTWDFVCVDEQQQPVAKFSARMFGVKYYAKIEMLGPKALDTAARDEIVLVGLTLYYCWVIRCNNPLNLVGSATLSKDKMEKAGKVDKAEGFDGLSSHGGSQGHRAEIMNQS